MTLYLQEMMIYASHFQKRRVNILRCPCLERYNSLLDCRSSRRKMVSTLLKYKYIKEILKKFRMEDSRLVGTPMSTGHNISKNDDSKEVDQTTYKSMIGKL